jgi:hypothetical protein
MMIIKPMDEVWTLDGHKLGIARRWHYRPDGEVSPGERLYAAYLEVKNFELGDVLYVPDFFLIERDEDSGHVLVDATMRQVMQWTWTRTPDFVVRGRSHTVLLGEATAVPAGQLASV